MPFFVSGAGPIATPPAPTLQYITSLKSQLETHFRPEDDQIETMRDQRELSARVPIPDELVYAPGLDILDPTATDEIARVVATLTLREPLCRVTPVTQSDAGQKAATNLEHFLQLTLEEAGGRVIGQHTYRSAADAAVADGGGWSKFLFTADTWEERYGISLADYKEGIDPDDVDAVTAAEKRFDEDTEEAKKRAGVPFTWLPVDARSIYPLWNGAKLAEVLEVTERPTFTTLQDYNMVVAGGKLVKLPDPDDLDEHVGQPLSEWDAKGVPKTCRLWEHWTATHCTILVAIKGSVQIGKQWEHGYGRVPYFFAPGLMANSWRGRKVGWGVAQSKLPLVQYRSFLFSIAAQDMVKQLGLPVAIHRAATAEAIIGEDGVPKTTEDENFGLNKIFAMGPDDKFERFPAESVNPAIKDMLAYTSAVIEQLDTPRVRGEIGAAGLGGAGFAINQVLSEAKTKHDPFIKGLEQMLVEVSRFALHLIKVKVKERVWVEWTDPKKTRAKSQWIGIEEKDLKHVAKITWKVDPEQPSAKLVETRWLTERVQQGRLGKDQAIESEGENPDEVRRAIRMDELRNEPWYKLIGNMELLQELGQGDLMRRAAEMAARTGVLPGMSPELIAQLIQQAQLATQYAQYLQTQNQPPGPAAPAGMGTAANPDMGNLAMAPQGGGAEPIRQNGAVTGAGPGAVVPAQAAAAGLQDLGS